MPALIVYRLLPSGALSAISLGCSRLSRRKDPVARGTDGGRLGECASLHILCTFLAFPEDDVQSSHSVRV